MQPNLTLRQWLIAAIISMACIAGYLYLNSHAYIKIKVDTASSTSFRLYWKNGDYAQYADSRSKKIRLHSRRSFYTAPIGDLSEITHLRIDPSNNTSFIKISEISIYQPGFEPIKLRGKALSQLKPIKDVSALSIKSSGMSYRPESTDSQFEYVLKLKPNSDTLWTHLWRAGLFVIFGLLLARAYPSITFNLRHVPALMLLIVALITTMSVISRPHAHPDEHAHLRAAQYYYDHSVPPPACAQDTLSTYTVYGTSRLNNNELSYYIAGKFLKLTESIPLDYYLKLRLFNVGLFVLLLMLAMARPDFRIVLLPLLISPQVWYVFSYFNSDAFAIFSTLLIAYQITGRDTLFKGLIKGNSSNAVLSFITLSVLACFLLFVKKNFYFFTLFILGAGVMSMWLYHRKQAIYAGYSLKPAFGLLLVATLSFGSWSFYQQSINDFDRSGKMLECREQTARSSYKPSTPIDKAHWSLNFEERGVSLSKMLDRGWAKSVFTSAFGNFGYFEHPASLQHFQIVGAVLLSMMAYLYYAIIRRGNAFQKWLLAGFSALFVFLVAITIYKNWTVDYQPQGRYYFALVSILGALLGWSRSAINQRILSFFVFILFGLGFYIFISVALLEIAKT